MSRSRSRASLAGLLKDDELEKVAVRIKAVVGSINLDSIQQPNNNKKQDAYQNLLDKYNGKFANVSAEDRDDVIQEVHSLVEDIKPVRYELSGQLEELQKLLAQINVLIKASPSRDSAPAESSSEAQVPTKKRRRGTATSIVDSSDSHEEPLSPARAFVDFSSLPVIDSPVAFRMRRYKSGEEEWIECIVVKILSEGTRYEVQDPEPDDQGNPGQSYRASIKDLIVIPPQEFDVRNLPEFSAGTTVLARYPDTTSFYRAEVTGLKKDGAKYRLKFEGEEEEGKETEVERRLVLPASK